ncbi:hypothetical protein BS47DRAFT_1374427 [Hydnum rufescens UP504]|uniref:Uncharacterized protein n=1 Tax=Hydnum rufescens UP504 TaxID=1448309 RepID=A0A9P6ADU4_9AGAM|nr:hypothetical protein BS47DRAFT_1374427 [Hydnum rufescens UP504]
MFLNIYANDSVAWGNGWIVASLVAATAAGKGQWLAQHLREWCHAYIKDSKNLLTNAYGRWNVSMLVSNEDLAQDITLHLQGLGPFISALDIVRYLDTPEIKTHLGLERSISLKTASWWMWLMQYHWGKEPKGQYVDGHEWDDVVTYRQSTFLPAWAAVDAKTHKFDDGGNLDPLTPVSSCPTVIWNHNDKTAKPYAKGKGTSLMVADFVSPDYGWLREPVFLRPGKERDSYFMCDEVLAQVTKAMDVLDKHYRMEDHVFVYDNVTTHKKHADNALSARHMPKYPPNPNGKGRKKGENWGVKVPLLGPNGNVIHGSDRKVVKVFKKMADAQFSDGRPQPLYFPDDHPQYPGLFKGMAVILEERGFSNARSLKAKCKGFKCAPGIMDCCCQRILFNQPDFVGVKSLLEDVCERRGYRVIFLPKFHLELNFIEMCWGYAKQVYRQFPISSDPMILEKNALAALESILLLFSNRSLRFMDGYRHGLNGSEAIWAVKKYRSHRCLPPELVHEIEFERKKAAATS